MIILAAAHFAWAGAQVKPVDDRISKMKLTATELAHYWLRCILGMFTTAKLPTCLYQLVTTLRALVTYLNVVQCIPFKRIAELISDLSGQNISEGTVQNILKENSGQGRLCI